MITQNMTNYTRPAGILLDATFDIVFDAAYNFPFAKVNPLKDI